MNWLGLHWNDLLTVVVALVTTILAIGAFYLNKGKICLSANLGFAGFEGSLGELSPAVVIEISNIGRRPMTVKAPYLITEKNTFIFLDKHVNGCVQHVQDFPIKLNETESVTVLLRKEEFLRQLGNEKIKKIAVKDSRGKLVSENCSNLF